eukprot:45604-Chlamydomonas_euryale.AAC.1
MNKGEAAAWPPERADDAAAPGPRQSVRFERWFLPCCGVQCMAGGRAWVLLRETNPNSPDVTCSAELGVSTATTCPESWPK